MDRRARSWAVDGRAGGELGTEPGCRDADKDAAGESVGAGTGAGSKQEYLLQVDMLPVNASEEVVHF